MSNFCSRLRGLYLFTAAATCSLIPAHAAAICPSGTAASYVALGSGGCQLGNLLFNNFLYTSTANPSVLGIPADAVAINPIPVLFNEGFGFQISSGFATTQPGSFIDGVLQFAVSTTDRSASLTGLSLNTNGTSTGTGLASVSENFCPGGASTVNCPGLRNISVQSAGGSLTISTNLGRLTELAVSKDINVSAGANGTATTSLVNNQFSNTSPVPEPGTLTLLGLSLGLGGLGLARRRTP